MAKAARSVNESNRSLSRYLEEIGNYEPLLPAMEVELAIKIHKNDERALEELVKANLRFVVSVAKDYQGQGLPLTDLINEGNLGLIKAAGRFDETRGFKFISYAVWWIRQSILQALAEHSRIVRLPLNRVGTISKITKTAEKLEAEIERSPNEEEIGRQLEMTPDEVSGYRILVGANNVRRAKIAADMIRQGRAVPAPIMASFAPIVKMVDDIARGGYTFVRLLQTIHDRAKAKIKR